MVIKSITADEATSQSSDGPNYEFSVSFSGTLSYERSWEWVYEDGVALEPLNGSSRGVRCVFKAPDSNTVITVVPTDSNGSGAYVAEWSAPGGAVEAIIASDHEVEVELTVGTVPVTPTAAPAKRRILILAKPPTDLGDATLRAPGGV